MVINIIIEMKLKKINMKNIIKNTRDIQTGENRIFLRLPMKQIVKEKLEMAIEAQKMLEISSSNGNIPAMLGLIMFNQMMIWNKLKGK